MEIIAGIVTIISGYLGAGFLGLTFNWPDAGAVVAIAVLLLCCRCVAVVLCATCVCNRNKNFDYGSGVT